MMIAVTGSTGAVGGLVARRSPSCPPDSSSATPRAPPDLGGEVRSCDVRRRERRRGRTRGHRGRSSWSRPRRPSTAATSTAPSSARPRPPGVQHIVYTSFAGAAADATFTLGRDHFDAEAAIRESGMAWTLLRDNFYADLLPYFADPAGVIRGPAGDGRVAAVARADVADVATTVLRAPADHAGSTYTLTGPEALTLTEVAARAGAVLGRELRFENETVEEAYASRRAAYDAEQWQLDAWVSTYTAIADGSVAEVTDDVRSVTGQPARTLEQSLTR